MQEQNREIDLATIEISEEHAKKQVDLLKSMERLTKNRDFKKVVLEGYFEQEAIRLVLLKADPNLQGEHDQADLIKQIDSVGLFRQYCHRLMQLGRIAEKELVSLEETREEILAEEEEV